MTAKKPIQIKDPKQVVKHFGGIRETADALGLTTAAIYKWLSHERIPYGSQILIELRTSGRMVAVKEKKK